MYAHHQYARHRPLSESYVVRLAKYGALGRHKAPLFVHLGDSEENGGIGNMQRMEELCVSALHSAAMSCATISHFFEDSAWRDQGGKLGAMTSGTRSQSFVAWLGGNVERPQKITRVNALVEDSIEVVSDITKGATTLYCDASMTRYTNMIDSEPAPFVKNTSPTDDMTTWNDWYETLQIVMQNGQLLAGLHIYSVFMPAMFRYLPSYLQERRAQIVSLYYGKSVRKTRPKVYVELEPEHIRNLSVMSGILQSTILSPIPGTDAGVLQRVVESGKNVTSTMATLLMPITSSLGARGTIGSFAALCASVVFEWWTNSIGGRVPTSNFLNAAKIVEKKYENKRPAWSYLPPDTKRSTDPSSLYMRLHRQIALDTFSTTFLSIRIADDMTRWQRILITENDDFDGLSHAAFLFSHIGPVLMVIANAIYTLLRGDTKEAANAGGDLRRLKIRVSHHMRIIDEEKQRFENVAISPSPRIRQFYKYIAHMFVFVDALIGED